MRAKNYILLLLLLLSFNAFAQQNYKRMHKDAFEEATLLLYEEDYYTALSIFKELYPLDTNYAEINYTIGLCLMNIRGKEDSAFTYLTKAVNGNVKEATFWMHDHFIFKETSMMRSSTIKSTTETK